MPPLKPMTNLSVIVPYTAEARDWVYSTSLLQSQENNGGRGGPERWRWKLTLKQHATPF